MCALVRTSASVSITPLAKDARDARYDISLHVYANIRLFLNILIGARKSAFFLSYFCYSLFCSFRSPWSVSKSSEIQYVVSVSNKCI